MMLLSALYTLNFPLFKAKQTLLKQDGNTT